jgi:3-oxoacyl-[acyl-carrier protein] reductase
MNKKAIIVAGSRGIGKAIADSITDLNYDVQALSKDDLDTSDIEKVRNFLDKKPECDILVLNTGGPPAKSFFDITEEDFNKYYNQLFLSFCLMLQNIDIKDNGFVFLISSYNIKEPNADLVLSNSYRLAFTSVLKSVSKVLASKSITCINIAPGPVKTDRLYALNKDISSLEERLPLKRAAEPEEIGTFVRSIVENNIKYLNGVTINFDGGHSNFVL